LAILAAWWAFGLLEQAGALMEPHILALNKEVIMYMARLFPVLLLVRWLQYYHKCHCIQSTNCAERAVHGK
jgi:hypothetical protein